MASSIVVVCFLLGVVSLASGFSYQYAPCRQVSEYDFRADETDCSKFHMCSLGQLVPFTCSGGSVFDERTRSCVPANSVYDTCTRRMAVRQLCAQGQQGKVPHPTQCALYYDCTADHTHNRLGWESQQRECPYPLIFSLQENKCVQSAPGVCGLRVEPLDQCDYKENQCANHAVCIPCHVRFPTCRGLPDGLNSWYGREGSPYYVTCHQQRVQTSAMCEQEGAVFVFDQTTKRCVKQEEQPQVPHMLWAGATSAPNPPQQHLPQDYVPFPAQGVLNQNQNSNANQQPVSGNGFPSQNQYGGVQGQVRYVWV